MTDQTKADGVDAKAQADSAAVPTAPLVDSKAANPGSSPDKDAKEVVGQLKDAKDKAVKDAEEKEEHAEDAEGEDGGKGKANKGWLRTMFPKGARMHEHRGHLQDDEYPRTWEFSLAVRSMTNVTTEAKLDVFFSVTLKNNKNKSRSLKGLLPRFTPIFRLQKGKQYTLDQPLALYTSKHFQMSYADLEKWDCQVDMWKVQHLSFNTYFGVSKKTLAEILQKDSNRNLILERKKTKKQMASKKERKKKWDVAEFECSIIFEEFFQFHLVGDHWTLDMQKYDDQCSEKEFERRQRMRKRLWLQVPPNKHVLPDQPRLGGLAGRPNTNFAHWNRDRGKKGKAGEATPYWETVGKFIYKGTRSQLTSSYFTVAVYMGDPNPHVVDTPALQPLRPAFSNAKLLGKAMMSFIGILEESKMQAVVKRLDGETMRPVADLSGSMRCEPLSLGLTQGEFMLPMKYSKLYSMGQPIAAGNVANLNKRELFLVLRIKQCRNLPMSDPDKGSSNPYVRATWDNMRQRGPVKMETLRPIFNFNFYFPVRSNFMRELKKKKNPSRATQLWAQEMQSKKDIRMEVWDDETAASEYLGGVSVSVKELLMSKTKDVRTMLGETKSVDAGDDEEEEDAADDDAEDLNDTKGKEWFQIPTRTRIFDCKNAGLPLMGSELGGNTGPSTVHFEAYFYPDLEQLKEFTEDAANEEKILKNFWEIKRDNFDEANEDFQKEFVTPFPNAVGAKATKQRNPGNVTENVRRFPSLVQKEKGAALRPLMCFLTPITVPEALSTPMAKMHWMRCLTWEVASQKQIRDGLIPNDGGWKPPSFILQRRRGAAQCHSLVLCSLLLGAKMDAYVCKGTIWAQMPAAEGHAAAQHLVEHVWVMTREEEGWITFWETTSGKCYHLPKRYTPKKENADEEEGKKKKKGKKTKGGAAEDVQEDEETNVKELQWEGEVEDVTVEQEDIEALPTVGRHPKAKAKVSAKRKEELDTQELKKKEMIAKKEESQFAPVRDMRQPDTLVNWLPYESIDVIFNTKNLWANHQNHNPALIRYDFDEVMTYEKGKSPWLPFLDKTALDEKEENGIDIEPEGDANISLSKRLEQSQVGDLRKQIIDELEENLRLYRSHNGLDTNFAKDEQIMEDLIKFLEIQEELAKLDIDFLKDPRCQFKSPEMEAQIKKEFLGNVRPHNARGSAFMENANYKKSKDEQERILDRVQSILKNFNERSEDFPVKRGKVFRGVTVHFSTSDVEAMRTYLMNIEQYKQKINVDNDNIFYTIQCYIAPMSGAVNSIWVYLGTQEDMTGEEEEEARKEDGDL